MKRRPMGTKGGPEQILHRHRRWEKWEGSGKCKHPEQEGGPTSKKGIHSISITKQGSFLPSPFFLLVRVILGPRRVGGLKVDQKMMGRIHSDGYPHNWRDQDDEKEFFYAQLSFPDSASLSRRGSKCLNFRHLSLHSRLDLLFAEKDQNGAGSPALS